MDEDAAGLEAWLQGLGLGQYEQAFRNNNIDTSLLPTLTCANSAFCRLGIASGFWLRSQI